MFTSVLQHIRQRAASFIVPLIQPIDDQMIIECYQVILGRSPLSNEVIYWKQATRIHRLTLHQLIRTFNHSDEANDYRQKCTSNSAPHSMGSLQYLTLPNFTMYVPTDDHFVGAALINTARYEPHVTNIFRQILKPGSIVVDIGANIGYFSLLASHLVGSRGHIYAIEPNKRNCALIWLSSMANNFQNIDVFPLAASHTVQEIVLHVTGSNGKILSPSERRHAHIPDTPTAESLPIGCYLAPTASLDSLPIHPDHLDLIKIDIEGAEPYAIQGMQALIAKYQPIIISEFSLRGLHQTAQIEPFAYIQQLRNLGYQLYVINEMAPVLLPQDFSSILTEFFAAGNDHIDLVCYPNQNVLP